MRQYLHDLFIVCLYHSLPQAAELQYKYIWKSQPDYETFCRRGTETK